MTERERVAEALDNARCDRMGIPRRWHEPWPDEWRAPVRGDADAALSAMSPAWRPIPAEVREGEAPWTGDEFLLGIAGTNTRRIGRWMRLRPGIGQWLGIGNVPLPFTHYAPIPPLPAPPSAEEG